MSLNNATLVLALLVGGAGCDLEWESGYYTCHVHDDCADGWTCWSSEQCALVSNDGLEDDTPVVGGSVREEMTVSVRGFYGYAGEGDYVPTNLVMEYGTIEYVGAGVFLYTSRFQPQITMDYVDHGSYEVPWASHTPPVKVGVAIDIKKDRAPAASALTVDAVWDQPVTFDVPVKDPDQDPLTTTIVTPPAHGIAIMDGSKITYRSHAGYFGTDQLEFESSDGRQSGRGTVNIKISCGAAVADAATTSWYESVQIDASANDTIPDASLTVIAPPTSGTVEVVNGQFVYQPSRGYIGMDTFRYRATTSEGCPAEAVVTVGVTHPVELVAYASPRGELAVTTDSNLVAYVAPDMEGTDTIFLWNAATGVAGTTRAVMGVGGSMPNASVRRPHLSGDGRYLAFDSRATNLVAGVTVSGLGDVYVLDRTTGVIELVSRSGANGGNNESSGAQITDDGALVSFVSVATDLVPSDTNAVRDVFVRDRNAGTTERVSVATDGGPLGGCGTQARISANGRIVAFACNTTLYLGQADGYLDRVVRDRMAGTTTVAQFSSDDRVEMARGGRYVGGYYGIFDVAAGTSTSVYNDHFSDDGRYYSDGKQVRDREAGGAYEDVCRDRFGLVAPGCGEIVLAGNGRTLVFTSNYDLLRTTTMGTWPTTSTRLYRTRR